MATIKRNHIKKLAKVLIIFHIPQRLLSNPINVPYITSLSVNVPANTMIGQVIAYNHWLTLFKSTDVFSHSSLLVCISAFASGSAWAT